MIIHNRGGPLYVVLLLYSCGAFRESGALGSRLTGAGWGGCCVSMVPSEKVESFLRDVRQRYYEAKGWPVSNQCLFPTKSGSGAHIIRM